MPTIKNGTRAAAVRLSEVPGRKGDGQDGGQHRGMETKRKQVEPVAAAQVAQRY
jgi:hypothetical protein